MPKLYTNTVTVETDMENKVDVKSTELGRVGERPFWILTLSILIRAIHQVGAAVFLASYLVEGVGEPSLFYLVLVIVSGVLLFFSEGMRHRQIYREVSGWSTFIKLILIGGAIHGLLPVTFTILAAFIIACLGAHAPKIIRHRLLF